MEINKLSQHEIALLRVISIAPGFEQRVYARKAVLAPLANLGLINGNAGRIKLTPHGVEFLREHKLDLFGYEEKRHGKNYPMQVANNKALTEAMATFTGSYLR